MEHNCPNHTETRELVTKVKAAVDSAHLRIDRIETDNKILHEMNTNIAVLAEQYRVQGGKIECIEVDIKEMKEKPAKNWNALVTVIITAVASGIVGYVISQIAR